jgi:hypothetical protein
VKVFFDERMAVAVADGSTPSHAKPLQVAGALRATALPIAWQAVTPVEWDELAVIHDSRYLRAVRTGEPPEVVAEASVVWSPELAESLRWTVGSMVGAARCAAESGCAASLSSGFHHAHYARPGTFCLVNGLVLAALRFLDRSDAKPVLILDCDYHTYRQAYDRDRRVFDACRRRDTPIAWNLAGGYQHDEDGGISPVLRGHLNTFIACAAVFDGWEGMGPALS